MRSAGAARRSLESTSAEIEDRLQRMTNFFNDSKYLDKQAFTKLMNEITSTNTSLEISKIEDTVLVLEDTLVVLTLEEKKEDMRRR